MDSELQSRLASALAPAYEIEGELGRGGMAIVYCGRDTRLKRPVAIKLLPPELAFRGDIRSRFMREAETAARLSHPNIVPIYSVDERDGLVFFVMSLVQGESVGDRLRRAGAFPIVEARRILREVADALAYAHANGVVHRDIKPDNILLDAASGRAMVTDFGIARAASDDGDGSRLTATGAVIGTPAYMSPEQCAGDREIDGRSDLYSLGTVAYQMLAGEPPFIGGNTPSIMMKQVTERPIPLRQKRTDVPDGLERIVMRLLAKSPNDRFIDGAALVAALDGAPVAPMPQRATIAPSILDERLAALPRIARNVVQAAIDTQARIDPSFADKLLAPREEFRQRMIVAAQSRAERRAARRGRDDPARPLPERIRRLHGRLVGYMGTTVFLFAINAVTEGPHAHGHHFWWAVFPALAMGLAAIKDVGRLLGDGASFRDIINGMPRSTVAEGVAAPVAEAPVLPARHGSANEELRNGPYGSVLVQAMADRQTVNDLLGRLTEIERKMLPDVKDTADALFARVVALAAALQRLEGQVGAARLPALDERIAQIEKEPADSGDRERRLNLLRRQRDMLAELVQSRAKLLGQYESAGILLQNLALDLLKVRSSGLDSAMNGISSATQEARALSREIGYVLDAADELTKLGDQAGAKST
jgi:serine/threonine protein kinase